MAEAVGMPQPPSQVYIDGRDRPNLLTLPWELRNLVFEEALATTARRPIAFCRDPYKAIDTLEMLGTNVNLLRACSRSRQLAPESRQAFYRINLFQVWDYDIPRFLKGGIKFDNESNWLPAVTAWITRIRILIVVNFRGGGRRPSYRFQHLLACPRLRCVEIRLSAVGGMANRVTPEKAGEIRRLCRALRKKAVKEFRVYI